jgi:hypothetical protein
MNVGRQREEGDGREQRLDLYAIRASEGRDIFTGAVQMGPAEVATADKARRRGQEQVAAANRRRPRSKAGGRLAARREGR